MMNRTELLSYFFNRLPDPNFHFTKLTLAIGLLLIIAGFALTFIRRRYIKDEILKKMVKKYPGMLRTYGLFVLILLLIRETGIPFLSIRFFWLVLAGFFVYHLLKFLFTFKKEYRMRLEVMQKHTVGKQYLPKKKR